MLFERSNAYSLSTHSGRDCRVLLFCFQFVASLDDVALNFVGFFELFYGGSVAFSNINERVALFHGDRLAFASPLVFASVLRIVIVVAALSFFPSA